MSLFSIILGLKKRRSLIRNMDKRCLIVGDGNFTFSLAFCNKHAFECWTVVATSFEKKDKVIERYGIGSAAVIDTLTTDSTVHGAKQCNVHCNVMYEVDGTKLDRIPFNEGYFQLIIFNFPHCGGKSNIKANQTLLREFFIASSKILDPKEGEVWVTLCKGQGGTPQDDLSRGYTNTWKIVEQAAEGGLILTSVLPFEPSDWPGYTQTGYRGMEKGFMVEGALTHVFRAPYKDDTIGPHCTLKGCRYCCADTRESPQLLTEALYYPALLEQDWHPLVTMRDNIMNLTNRRLMDINLANATGTEGEYHTTSSSLLYHKRDSRCLSNSLTDSSLCIYSQDGGTPSEEIVLESDLEQRLPSIVQHILIHNLEYMFVSGVCVVPQHAVTTVNSYNCKPFVTHQLMLCGFVAIDVSILNDLVQRILTELIVCDESRGSIRCTTITNDSESTKTMVTFCGTLVATGNIYSANFFAKNTRPMFSCIFELDQLVMVKYKIPDVRVLWSKDRRLYKHFTESTGSLDPPPSPAVYLYPPSYSHDVSFWVSCPCQSDHDATISDHGVDMQSLVKTELDLLIRKCCGMLVVSVCMIDVYKDSVNGGRISYCFRLTYSPFDTPMTFMDSKEIQGKLRESIASTPGWELR